MNIRDRLKEQLGELLLQGHELAAKVDALAEENRKLKAQLAEKSEKGDDPPSTE